MSFVEGKVDSERYDLPNYLYPELYEQCLDKGCPYLSSVSYRL
jgi:hypothetical protein